MLVLLLLLLPLLLPHEKREEEPFSLPLLFLTRVHVSERGHEIKTWAPLFLSLSLRGVKWSLRLACVSACESEKERYVGDALKEEGGLSHRLVSGSIPHSRHSEPNIQNGRTSETIQRPREV